MSLITLTYIFSTGATIIASQHNTNNSTIYNDYNGNITDANIAANAAIAYTKLSLNNSIRASDILSTTVFNISNIPINGIAWQWPYVKVSETQTSGTSGGSATTGSFITRVLNTKDSDTGSIATLTSNQVTLPSGSYLVRISSPFYATGPSQIRLQNITASTTLLIGTSINVATTIAATIPSTIVGEITLSGSSALAVQYQVTNHSSTDDLGQPASFGTEVYTVAEFTKIG